MHLEVGLPCVSVYVVVHHGAVLSVDDFSVSLSVQWKGTDQLMYRVKASHWVIVINWWAIPMYCVVPLHWVVPIDSSVPVAIHRHFVM